MLVRTSRTLTYAGARLALDAGLARAAETEVAVNIAVCDNAGVVLAFARMDGAFAWSGDIARDKAATVCGFGGAPTDALYAAVADEPAVRDGIANRSGVAAFSGGVPLHDGTDLLGAVGVSGGSAQQDKDIALAAATALLASLADAPD